MHACTALAHSYYFLFLYGTAQSYHRRTELPSGSPFLREGPASGSLPTNLLDGLATAARTVPDGVGHSCAFYPPGRTRRGLGASLPNECCSAWTRAPPSALDQKKPPGKLCPINSPLFGGHPLNWFIQWTPPSALEKKTVRYVLGPQASLAEGAHLKRKSEEDKNENRSGF